jgi:hypothetical protein
MRTKVTILILMTLCCVPASSQELPRVIYRADTAGYFSDHLKITRLDRLPESITEIQKKENSNKTAYYYVHEADFTKSGPWNSYAVVDNIGEGNILELRFLDHASYGVRLDWINDKLLHVKEYLGRIIALDLILDTSNGKLIYQEVEDYFQILHPEQLEIK